MTTTVIAAVAARPVCPKCGNARVNRNGSRRAGQYWLCMSCRHRFYYGDGTGPRTRPTPPPGRWEWNAVHGRRSRQLPAPKPAAVGCIHHWLLDTPGEGTTMRCKKCAKEQPIPTSKLDTLSYKDSMKLDCHEKDPIIWHGESYDA